MSRDRNKQWKKQKNGNNHNGKVKIEDLKIKDWLENGAKFENLKNLRTFAEENLKHVSAGFARKFYGIVIEAFAKERGNPDKIYKKLLKLLVISSYEKGRRKENDYGKLTKLIEHSIKELDELMEKAKDDKKKETYLNNFKDLMEALVGFHREFAINKK